MKEDLKMEELDGVELLKLIYEELKSTRIELNEKIDKVYNELNEKIDKVYNELNEKIDRVYNELNEKIDNTKDTLVFEIAEELKSITDMTSKSINNLEKKLDNEIEDRKVDVSKVKDFNRIILNDIRSRVSILEEETEKYNLK